MLQGSSQGREPLPSPLGHIESGAIKPLAATYKLSVFHRAQPDFTAKGFVGKLVVVPDSKWDQYGG